MGKRQKLISASILRAIDLDLKAEPISFLQFILSFVALFRLKLTRFAPVLFRNLRSDIWQFDDKSYHESFSSDPNVESLIPIGDLGYSGSTFFTTSDSKFLIKSLPRRFEYAFFRSDLLRPYHAHMSSHPTSLLVRITDLLCTPTPTLGALLGLTPSHHVVMENTLYGRNLAPGPERWETFDLKPTSYFFPERDFAGGALASEATLSRLADDFPDKIRVREGQSRELIETLESDTELLKGANVVDYSLFLVRWPRDAGAMGGYLDARASGWRKGAESTDGKWVYRAVLLDFFWAKHTAQAKVMDGLIGAYNVFGGQGPMSVTTTPEEYRERFLKMVRDMVVVEE